MRKIILVLFAVFCIVNLSACFSPWEGHSGEGLLTVNIGSSARSVFYDTAVDEVESFSHAITLKDDNGQIISSSSNFQGTSITIKDIKVGKTYSLNIKGSDKDGVRSFGMESSILIKPGQNKVTVDMYSAVDVGDHEGISDAFDTADEEKNSDRMLYVIINNTFSVNDTISINSGNVTLIAEDTVEISLSRGSGSMFRVNGGTLNLGVKGMAGTITLTGLSEGNGNNAPLINVNGGTLVMDGVTISGNNNRGNGGGVSVTNGGTFRIITGTIYGSDEEEGIRNTAATGAALYLSGGTVEYGTFSGSTWKSNGSLLTNNGTIRVVNGVLLSDPDIPGNFIITFAQIDDDIIVDRVISLSDNGSMVTFEVEGQYDSIAWYIPAIGVSGNESIFTLDLASLYSNTIDEYCEYYLTLEVWKDGVPYNKTIFFTILP